MWSSHILLSNFTTICSFFLLSSVIAHVAKWVEGSSHYSDPAAYLEIGVDRYGKLCKYFTKFCAELAIAEDDVCNHQDEGTNKTRQAFILYFLFFISCYFFLLLLFLITEDDGSGDGACTDTVCTCPDLWPYDEDLLIKVIDSDWMYNLGKSSKSSYITYRCEYLFFIFPTSGT